MRKLWLFYAHRPLYKEEKIWNIRFLSRPSIPQDGSKESQLFILTNTKMQKCKNCFLHNMNQYKLFSPIIKLSADCSQLNFIFRLCFLIYRLKIFPESKILFPSLQIHYEILIGQNLWPENSLINLQDAGVWVTAEGHQK